MDEVLKALLILNALNYDLRVWEKFKKLNAEPRELWQNPGKFTGDVFSEAAVSKISLLENSGWAEKEVIAASNDNAEIVTLNDDLYPKQLSDLSDAPLILYMKGKIKKIPDKTVAVVGTRRASQYGRKIAKTFGERCALEETAVISGGATGIDGNAHLGCCERNGITFAVFGTGLDVEFPASNRQLFEMIKENGSVITEFPYGTAGEAWHFPRRNRIVAAMATRVVVVEAPFKSGAMITAKLALDLGREIWAVPGRINEEVCNGSNRLIYDGAYPLADFDLFFGTSGKKVETIQDVLFSKKELIESLSSDQQTVLNSLSHGRDKTADKIAAETSISPNETMKILAYLLAVGLVCSSGPGRYSVSDR